DEQNSPEMIKIFDDCDTILNPDCENRLCSRNEFSCGSSQCIPWVNSEHYCNNSRDIYYRCEINELITTSKGNCLNSDLKTVRVNDNDECTKAVRDSMLRIQNGTSRFDQHLMHVTYLIVSHQSIVINSLLNLILCKSLDTIIISLSYSAWWLSTFVTGERVLSVLKPIGFLTLKTPKCAMIITCAILFATFGSSAYTHGFMYKIVVSVDKNVTWCVREISPFHQHFVSGLMIIHTTIPFILNFIFAMIIIVIISRTKTNIHNLSHRQTFFTQIRQRQDLLLGPILYLILQTPQLVIQFLNGCSYSNNTSFTYIVLTAYYISFIPQITIFFFYVLTSPSYKAALLEEARICRWFNKKFGDEVTDTTSSKQCENLKAIALYHLTGGNQDDPTVIVKRDNL
ncbi:unnamed protein product, partial [Didymodactylos carnosus]